MRKLNNGDLFDSMMVLSRLSEKGKLGYIVACNRRIIGTALTEYVSCRDEILRKYGNVADDGNYHLTTEGAVAAETELKEFSDIEQELPLMTVDVDTFCGGNLTSQEMYILNWMVE